MGPQSMLSLQWTEYAPNLDYAQHYVYRVYVEGQTGSTQLKDVGCEGPSASHPPLNTQQFHCRAQPPPLVSKPGLYRVTLTAAQSLDSQESYPSASAPFNVLYPATQPPGGIVVRSVAMRPRKYPKEWALIQPDEHIYHLKGQYWRVAHNGRIYRRGNGWKGWTQQEAREVAATLSDVVKVDPRNRFQRMRDAGILRIRKS